MKKSTVPNSVINWQKYLITKGFKDDDYLFPQINSSFNKEGLSILSLSKDKLSSDSRIRTAIFKKAFVDNGLGWLKVHSFRHSITKAMKKSSDPISLSIALAENDGHKTGQAVIIDSYMGDYLDIQSKLMKEFDLENN